MVIAAIEGHVAGVFGLVDTLRPEAKGVVSELTGMGLEVSDGYPESWTFASSCDASKRTYFPPQSFIVLMSTGTAPWFFGVARTFLLAPNLHRHVISVSRRS